MYLDKYLLSHVLKYQKLTAFRFPLIFIINFMSYDFHVF